MEEITAETTQMIALVRGSVARGVRIPPPKTHVIKSGAVSYTVELYGQSLTRYFSKLGQTSATLKFLKRHLLCCNACLER